MGEGVVVRSQLPRLVLCAALALATLARAGTQVKPQLSLMTEERYDDDLLLRQEAGGAGEFLTKVSPTIGANVDDHTYALKAWYAPDLLYHSGSGSLTVDHRGGLDLKKALSPRVKLDGSLEIWRVTDPTSLPRLGLAKTLSPVLYGKAHLDGVWQVAPRWQAIFGLQSEAAHVYEANSEPGYVEEPYAKALYALGHRSIAGVQYRYSLFLFGPDQAQAHGLFGEYDYRISRELTLRLNAGPVFFQRKNHPEQTGVLPKLDVELERNGPRLAWGLVVGHDLVGASGFTAALWADYASLAGTYKFSEPFHLLWFASFYRNGPVPNQGAFSTKLSGPTLSSGYDLGGGAEWQLSRALVARATVNRFAQLGGIPGEQDLSRNIYALRLIYTAW